MIWKDFWSENVMVRCPGDHMEFWSGGQEKDVAWSNGRIRGQKIWRSGTW